MAKVTSKGQITIPVSIRKRLGINEGDKLLFIDRPDGVMMVNPNMFQTDQNEELSGGSQGLEYEQYVPFSAKAASTLANTQSSRRKVSESAGSNAKEFDVAAILNEIRSIGSKMK